MFQSLFHITHVANVPGILTRGLHCRSTLQAAGIQYIDLSEPGCQARRLCRRVGQSTVNLHGFVPLFLNPHNAMVYRLGAEMKEEKRYDLAMLEVDGSVANQDHSLLADGIASSQATRLFWSQDPDAAHAIDWHALQTHTHQWRTHEERRVRMAEVLINQQLETRFIRKIWVQRQKTLHQLAQRLTANGIACCAVDHYRKHFYHG